MLTSITIPTPMYAGQNQNWTVTLPSYPASEYTLKAIFKFESDDHFEAISEPDGDNHKFTQPVKLNKSGFWSVQFVLIKISDNSIEDTTKYLSFEVKALLSDESDARSKNRIILSALWAVYQERATLIQTELDLPNGTKIGYLSHDEIIKQIGIFTELVKQEDRQAMGYKPQKQTLFEL